MAFKNYRTYCSTLLLIIIACQSEKLWGLQPKSTIKTIETDYGEVIDCVDIYKQPAFDNPLIKELKMSPSSYPVGIQEDSISNLKLFQSWQKYGECPDGTIPIRRSTSSNNDFKVPMFPMNENQNKNGTKSPNFGHEYAMVWEAGHAYYGAQAWFNTWSPKAEYDEFSMARMEIIGATKQGYLENYTSIVVGWIVYPARYQDNYTKLFTYWTRDRYKKTGCYDLDCQGFVQISKKIVIGGRLDPVSTYGGGQYEISFTVFKDNKTGDWWLQCLGQNVGYWPNSLLTGLANHANIVSWGGEIVNDKSEGPHTRTEMGSGHFPSEGFTKAAYVSRMKVINSKNVQRDPDNLKPTRTNPGCYDVKVDKIIAGEGFLYGGPGYSFTCIH